MKLLHRLLDRVFPWRVVRRQRDEIALVRESLRLHGEMIGRQREEIAHLTRERDTARKQFAETRSVNLHNAQAHRATEVAMLRQNHALQAAEARLAGKTVHPELAAAAKVPALPVPKPLPVQQPDQLSP